MSDTPQTDALEVASPEYAQRIQFEGCEVVAIPPEDYQLMHDHARKLERELTMALSHRAQADVKAQNTALRSLLRSSLPRLEEHQDTETGQSEALKNLIESIKTYLA